MLLRSRLMSSSKVCISKFLVTVSHHVCPWDAGYPLFQSTRVQSTIWTCSPSPGLENTFVLLARPHTKHNLSAVPHLAHPTISPSNAISPMDIKLLSVISAINQRNSISTSICLQSLVPNSSVQPASRLRSHNDHVSLPYLHREMPLPLQLYHRAAKLLWSRSLKYFLPPVLCPTHPACLFYVMVAY